ncbi:MAG: transcription termination/antitermination protein NusA [Eubacteriaceae bacterium]|nr:transcription termination/antitermination protein NusA [Eubacteriaceae bacterium]
MKKNTAQDNSLVEAIEALEEIVKTNGIDKETILTTFETAMASAVRRDFKGVTNVRSEIDRDTQKIVLAIQKTVVETVEDPANEISLEEARKNDPDCDLGSVVEFPVSPTSLGRVATQNAKQMVLQQLRECERQIIYDKFIEKKDELMVGTVQRVDRNCVYVDLGQAEGIMNYQNQIPGEEYYYNMRLRVYVSDVQKTGKGAQIYVSRSHPNFIRRLFEIEIPEVYDGTIEIRSIAREAGSRTKVAVSSENPDIECVGACVGPRGVRIQSILNEIGTEKIDVINYSDNPVLYISNAISPAEVVAIIPNQEEKTAVAIVEENQLSLAIGKDGQNVRLAARLTGWKIDIKTPEQYDEMMEAASRAEAEEAESIFGDDAGEVSPAADESFSSDEEDAIGEIFGEEEASADEGSDEGAAAAEDIFGEE